jgi:flagellar protein FliS
VNHAAVNAYGKTNLHSGLSDASPEKLIQLLLEGSTTRLNAAVAAMQAGNIAEKGELIGKTISIIEYLRVILDRDAAPEFTENLDSLYGYMVQNLVKANFHNDEEALKEVVGLISELRLGWSELVRTGINT